MKLKHILLSVFVAVGFALAVVAPVSAEKIPSAPTKTHIADNATIIDDQVEAQISQTIFDYEKKTGNQIAVYTFNSLDGNSIENYCHDTASKWGVGSKAVNNGAVLCVAVKDRKVRIEVGRGLEPSLTDLQSNLIIKQKITPAFKKNDYSGGIKSGVDSIIAVIGGERLSGSPSGGDWADAIFGVLPIAFFPLVYLGSFLARSKSWWAGGVIGAIPGGVMAVIGSNLAIPALIGGIAGGLFLDYILSKNYRQRVASGKSTDFWGSGGGFFGGFSGGSGGSGSSFGGGSFGGGGSSGSW